MPWSPAAMQAAMPAFSRSIAALLQLEREAELLGHRLPHPHRTEALQVGHAIEVQDAFDERIGVLHLADRFFAEVLREAVVAPVRAHLGVEEVLVDRGQLRRQHVVQQFDDRGVALHSAPAFGGSALIGRP